MDKSLHSALRVVIVQSQLVLEGRPRRCAHSNEDSPSAQGRSADVADCRWHAVMTAPPPPVGVVNRPRKQGHTLPPCLSWTRRFVSTGDAHRPPRDSLSPLWTESQTQRGQSRGPRFSAGDPARRAPAVLQCFQSSHFPAPAGSENLRPPWDAVAPPRTHGPSGEPDAHLGFTRPFGASGQPSLSCAPLSLTCHCLSCAPLSLTCHCLSRASLSLTCHWE